MVLSLSEPTAVQVNEPPIDLVDYIMCPQCRAEHKLIEPNGIDGFFTDFFIESQLREP